MGVGCPSLEWSTLLWEGLRAQFNKPKFSDLKVNVQGDSVHVHKVVLATQSEALSALLPDSDDPPIMNWSAHCNDINHAKDFLRSLYFGYGHIHSDNVLGLLKLAKIYNVKWLVDEAERFAKSHINHSNCLEYLDFSIFYDCAQLHEICAEKVFRFNKKYSLTQIAQPLVRVWLHISVKTLSCLIANDRLCVEDEIEVFQYVMCWVEAGQRENTSPLTLVRYGFLPNNFYALFALPYVMQVDPPLGAHLSELGLSCPVFNADTLRHPSPGTRYLSSRTYRHYRNDPSVYREAVVQISDDFLVKEKFRKSFSMNDFTLYIDVGERVSIHVECNKEKKRKNKTPTTILSNLDEENNANEALPLVTSSTIGQLQNLHTAHDNTSQHDSTSQHDIASHHDTPGLPDISSQSQHSTDSSQYRVHTAEEKTDKNNSLNRGRTEDASSSKRSSTSDINSSEVSSPGPSTGDDVSRKKEIVHRATSSGSRSDTSSSRDTLFYCYCLAPSSRQPLAMFRWWNNGGWHRANFDMLIKQANGTLALGVVVVR